MLITEWNILQSPLSKQYNYDIMFTLYTFKRNKNTFTAERNKQK